jgi:hypothetical protein
MKFDEKRKKKACSALLILLDLIDDETQQNLPKRRKRDTWVRSWIERRKHFSVIIILYRGRSFLSEFLQDEFTTFLVSCGPGIILYPKTKYSYAGKH